MPARAASSSRSDPSLGDTDLDWFFALGDRITALHRPSTEQVC